MAALNSQLNALAGEPSGHTLAYNASVNAGTNT